MPSAFDLFGPFENSLRSYRKPQWRGGRGKPCPHGLHTPSECTCDIGHECKRPHCANDVPLDPNCKLSSSMPFGMLVSIGGHKCSSMGCPPSAPSASSSNTASPTSVKSPPVIFSAVTDRLYSTRTQASAAKMRPSGPSSMGRSVGGGLSAILSDDGEDDENPALNGSSERKSRLISQLISDEARGSHDHTRTRDGASPSPTRRALSVGTRRSPVVKPEGAVSAPSSAAARRSKSSCGAVVLPGNGFRPRRPRGSESDGSSSDPSTSPDTSPGSTPSATPRKMLSPKNSGGSSSPRR